MARQLRKPLFYVRWEDCWDCSIAEIREDIRNAPVDGAWAWAYEEMQKS